MKAIVCGGVIGALAMFAHVSIGAAEDTRDLGLTVNQAAAYQVSAPVAATQKVANALKVTAWVDRENNTYHVGENVQLYVKSNKDAYITVLSVGASGSTVVLFPNQFQPDNFVRGGQITEVPGPASPAKITVSGPVGNELIKVVASTKNKQIFQQTTLQPAGPWQVVSTPVPQWTRDLTLTMQGQPVAAVTSAPPVAGVVATQPMVPVTTTQIVETGEWDLYNKTIRTVAAPAGVVGMPIVPTIPGTVQYQQTSVTPSGNIITTTWTHTATAPGPFPLTISLPKPTFTVGEVVPVQLVSQAPCNLLVTAGGSVPVYPASGQPVLIQANQPVVINGITARVSQTLVANCVPVGGAVGRDVGDTSGGASAQIVYEVQ